MGHLTSINLSVKKPFITSNRKKYLSVCPTIEEEYIYSFKNDMTIAKLKKS